MSKGRILFLRSYPSRLDFSTYNIQQFGMGKAFNELGYDFDFYTYTNLSSTETIVYEDKSNCTRTMCVEIKGKKVFNWGIMPEMKDKSFLEQYDAIVCQEYYQIMTYSLSKRSNKVSVYAGPYWNMFRSKAASFLYDRLFVPAIRKNTKVVLSKSLLMKNYLEGKGFKNVVNIGVALDIDRFKIDCSIDETTRELMKYMTDNKCLLFVGRQDPNKNFQFLCKVYEKILLTIPDIKLVVVGKSITRRRNNPEHKTYYEQIVESFPESVRNGIVHVEKIENEQLRYIYPLAKCLMLPSINEVFGMVLLEAMYLGCPVVSSNNGGSTTLITNGETGYIEPCFDCEKWAATVINIVNDASLSSRLITNSKKLIESNYTWTHLAKQMLTKIL